MRKVSENGTNTNAAIKEPLFPIELKRRERRKWIGNAQRSERKRDDTSIHNDGVKWHRPTSLKELLDLKDAYPGNDSKIVCEARRLESKSSLKSVVPERAFRSGNTIEELGRIRYELR